jgi:uncharacterized membrane protein
MSCGFARVFSGRGARLDADALTATVMTANVFFVSMANKRKSVAALIAGRAPQPAWQGVGVAPKGALLDTPERIAAFAAAIRLRAAMTHATPPNNLTEMTTEERATLARWLDGGALAQK